MSYINLGGLNLKIKPTINTDYQINTTSKSYLNNKGSYTRRTGKGSNKIELQVHARENDIQQIIKLSEETEPIPLVSESKANYNGQYHLTDFKIGERKKGIYDVTITLIEHVEYNITRKTFANWQRTTTTTTTSKPATTPANAYQTALKKCPTLRYGNRSECVKTLQRFLKNCGHYTYVNGHYLKIDGYFGPYTLNSVKAFQKKKKIRQDGIVGPLTKSKMGSC